MVTSKKFLTTQEYRIYPNVKQQELINQTLGCCRFVYNWNLAKAQAAYEVWKLNPESEKPKTSLDGRITVVSLWRVLVPVLYKTNSSVKQE